MNDADPWRLSRRTLLQSAGIAGALLAGVQLSGCADSSDERTSPIAPATTPTTSATAGPSIGPAGDTTTSVSSGAASALLVYFSRAGENYDNGGRTNLMVGNTAVVAGLIQAAIQVDVYEIEAADPYPDSYDETVARNVREQDDDARPAIAVPLPSLAAYDTVLIGSPIWNVRPPMIMSTFLDAVDLTGKLLAPFVTYAVSGLGRTIVVYTDLQPAATIADGLAVRGEQAADATPDIEMWLRELGLLTG